jgi:hypothetical protein
MTMSRENRDVMILQARAALIMAALRRSIVTYKEFGFAIGLKDIELRNEMRYVLEQLANECHNVGEPPITALVVNAQTGAPGAGWHGNGEPWHADVQRVFRYWAAQS